MNIYMYIYTWCVYTYICTAVPQAVRELLSCCWLLYMYCYCCIYVFNAREAFCRLQNCCNYCYVSMLIQLYLQSTPEDIFNTAILLSAVVYTNLLIYVRYIIQEKKCMHTGTSSGPPSALHSPLKTTYKIKIRKRINDQPKSLVLSAVSYIAVSYIWFTGIYVSSSI